MRNTNYLFVLFNLVLRDFRVRYRNMSLGIFWSLLNPLVMMTVLTLVFTLILRNTAIPNFHVFVLCGIVPFNFFAQGWISGTVSVFGNASLVKRVLFHREIVPVAAVLSSSIHFAIQIGLLLALAIAAGYRPSSPWLLLPVIFGLEIIFVCGLALASSALDVYFRDVRYVVESANTVLFWLVPIFYSFAVIPPAFHSLYQYNPVAAVVLACRHIVLEGKAPPTSLMWKLTLVSLAALSTGFLIFRRLKRRFSDYL